MDTPFVRYMEALAEAAPERTQLIRYAETWEGRPLYMIVIGSAERLAGLDEVLAGLQRLADPRGLDQADADRLLGELPVVTALVHGIHGNEISSSGAAMAEAYHLLAAQGDGGVDRILAESLVLIDPAQNPDGRARFVMQNTSAQARWPDEASWSAEHDEPWPGGRGNQEGLVLGGIVWDEAEPQLANKAYLLHQPVGRGQLIAFAEDPNYRAYAEATELLFINAVLLGPGR